MRPFSHSEAGPERGASATQVSWWMRNLLTNATVMVATHSPTVAALASRRIDVGQGDADGPLATVPGEANRQ